MTPAVGPALIAVYSAVTVAGEALPAFGTPAAKVAAAAFVLEAVVRRAREGGPGAPRALALWAAVGLLALGSLAWSQDPAATRRVALHLGQEALLLGALALHPRTAAVLRGAAVGAVLGGAILGLGTGWVYFAADDLRGVRISVGEGEPGVQARAAGAAVVLGIAALAARAAPGDRWALVGIALAGWGVGLAGSRGAWLAVGAALVVAGVLGPTVRRVVMVAAVSVAVGIGALTLRPDVRGPLPGVADADLEAITSGRDAIWRNAASIVREHPVRGVGAGAVPAAYEPHRRALEASGGPTSKPRRDAHSVYLEVAASLGLGGLLLLLAGFVAAARAAPGLRSVALPPLVFAAFAGLTLTTWEHTAWWLVLGWAAVAGQPAARDRTASSSGASATSGE